MIALTAEELYFLAGGNPIPGLGPLPLDPADPAALRLMHATAERSLRARGLLGAPEVAALLAPLAEPEWFATAVRPDGTGRAWCRRGADATELARLAPTDYALSSLEPAGIRARIAHFLDLHGDDAAQGVPEPLDEALLAPPAQVIEATRAAPGDIVALQWIDRGDAGPVWRLGDGDPVRVTRTGRGAILATLS